MTAAPQGPVIVTRGDGPVGLTAGEVIDQARALFNSWVGGKVAL